MLEKAQQCNDEFLRSAANQVEEMQVLLDSNLITEGEFKDLLEDIKRTVEIEEQCSDMETKADLIKAISIIAKIV